MELPRKLEKRVRQHELLCTNAATVIGKEREVELRLNRELDNIERLIASARESLMSADEARADNDHTRAEQHEIAAEMTAALLVDAERRVEDLRALHDDFLEAAGQARDAVEASVIALRKEMDEHYPAELSQVAKRLNDSRNWRSETRARKG